MLCQFSVKNYQCIKDELTLDMQATSISENLDSVIRDRDGEEFLPLCVIYGPNGGGKSTVLHALHSLAGKLLRPICAVSCENKDCMKAESKRSIEPFLFSKETQKQPTEFEIFIRTNQYEYQYKLALSRDIVVSESLFRKAIKKDGRYVSQFERKGSSIVLHGSLKQYDVSGLSGNLPLLSYFGITHRKNAMVKDVTSWFDTNLIVINYGSPEEDARIAVSVEPKIKAFVLKMLAEMDIDIADYRTEEHEKRLSVFTKHKVNGNEYELPFAAESNGSIKIFGMLPYIAESLLYGRTLVIDELDAKLHPILLQYIIRLYNDRSINKHNAQLIFTSHDLTTMNSENFRRDEIWFIAKGNDQSSKMYSLVEFKERKDAKYNKQYILGKYGADPYLKRIINWEEIENAQ